MNLSEFKGSKKPKGRSHHLHDHQNEIEDLLRSGYAHDQILEYLHLNNIDCSIYSLGYFIRHYIKNSCHNNQGNKEALDVKPQTSIKTTGIEKKIEINPENNSARPLDQLFHSQINMNEFAG